MGLAAEGWIDVLGFKASWESEVLNGVTADAGLRRFVSSFSDASVLSDRRFVFLVSCLMLEGVWSYTLSFTELINVCLSRSHGVSS